MKLLINLIILLPLNILLTLLWAIMFVLTFTIGALGLVLSRLGGYETRPYSLRIQSVWVR